MFFEKLASKIGAYKFKFSIEKSTDGKITVIMVPELRGKKADDVKQKLVPIVVTGTPQELDSPEFFKAIGGSLDKQITLAEQVEGYEKLVERLTKDVVKDANKEAKAASKPATKTTRKKKEDAAPKVEEAPAANEPVASASRIVEDESAEPAAEAAAPAPPVEEKPVVAPENDEEAW